MTKWCNLEFSLSKAGCIAEEKGKRRGKEKGRKWRRGGKGREEEGRGREEGKGGEGRGQDSIMLI